MIDTQSTSAGLCCTWIVVDKLQYQGNGNNTNICRYDIEMMGSVLAQKSDGI